MFRFTIRDVLWLTIVVAFGIVWWVDHRRAIRSESQVKQLTETAERQRTNVDALKAENVALKRAAVRVEQVLTLERQERQRDDRLDPSYPIYYPPQFPKP